MQEGPLVSVDLKVARGVANGVEQTRKVRHHDECVRAAPTVIRVLVAELDAQREYVASLLRGWPRCVNCQRRLADDVPMPPDVECDNCWAEIKVNHPGS